MEGPLRFQCPPEFEAAPPPGPSLSGAAPELWLIRAPPDFHPESLEGCSVPLDHSVQLRPPPHGGAAEDNAAHCLYGARGAPGGGRGPPPPVPNGPRRPLGLRPPPARGPLHHPHLRPPPAPPPQEKKRKKKEAMEEPPEGRPPVGRRGKHKEEAMG